MNKKNFEAPHCKDIIDLIPEPFVVINKEYQIVAANKQYRNKYQHGNLEIVGDTCCLLYTSDAADDKRLV